MAGKFGGFGNAVILGKSIGVCIIIIVVVFLFKKMFLEAGVEVEGGLRGGGGWLRVEREWREGESGRWRGSER